MFIVEFVGVVKLVEAELFHLYTDLYFYFEGLAFHSLVNHTNQQLLLNWWSDSAHLQ